MPRLIDWGVRYELAREAVIRIAAREGAGRVTLPAVAAEMRTSESTLRRMLNSPHALQGMGADLLTRLRRHRRLLRGRRPAFEPGSVEHLGWILALDLPRDEEEVEQALAWASLTGPGCDTQCAELLRDDEDYVEALLTATLDRLVTHEHPERREHAIRLRAVMDGLVVARCRQTVTLAEAQQCLTAEVRAVAREAARPTPAPAPPAAADPP